MGKAFRLALGLVLFAIMGSAVFISYKVFFSNPARSIPLLKGSTVIEAVQTLEQMGVKARIEEEESTLPRGTVIAQWPETGVKLRADKTAILKVSRGSKKVPLPDLRGLAQDQAVRRLQGSGFVVGEIQKINSDRPAGVVIAQNPATPASVPQGYTVGLLVSLGPTVAAGQVIVPDLIERQESVALQLARESALRPTVEYIYTQGSPSGMVIGMNPSAGSRVSRGSTVTLRVATMNTRYAPRTEPAPTQQSGSSARIAVNIPTGNVSTEARQETSEPAQQSAPQSAPQQPARPRPTPTEPARQAVKRATVRYQTPPVSNQDIVIEVIDGRGERRLLDRKTTASEQIRLDFEYTGSAVVTIYLGGNFVWQERYR